MDIKVIGAGLGGLAVSCLLARDGHKVTVFEQNETPGGKINQLTDRGFRFDTGPSLLTMPFILDKLFKQCNARLSDYLTLVSLDPICRYWYSDGTRFDCRRDTEKNLCQIEQFAKRDKEAYKSFLDHASSLYARTKDSFLFNPLYDLSDISSLKFSDLFRINALSTMSDSIDRYFQTSYLRQFFKRFATYNGSSPFQAPGTLNVIPHVELTLGGFYIDGGMYKLTMALTRLAEKMGVEFCYNSTVSHIKVRAGKVQGLTLNDQSYFPADLIFSNNDASYTYLNLLEPSSFSLRKRNRITKLEPSCSGFVMMLGIDHVYPQLLHHNVFFSEDYEKEFYQIFRQRVMPDIPTIYIANTSFSNPAHSPSGGSNLFILVNAPYLSDDWNWQEQREAYADHVIDLLEKRGLEHLGSHIVTRHFLTPKDFRRVYSSNRGSIYGTSSNNKMAAFLRPRNKSRDVEGLYLVGGSTHPGGGIPLVVLSALHSYHLAKRYDL